jgi:hypothetical protein
MPRAARDLHDIRSGRQFYSSEDGESKAPCAAIYQRTITVACQGERFVKDISRVPSSAG